MFITTKIAFRNVIANKRRSVLIGLVIFLTSFLLLAANAMVNGVEKQVLKSYENIQAADVVVIWEDLAKVAPADAARFLFLQPNTFDKDQESDNRKAMDNVEAYLKEHDSEVSGFYPLIRRNATLLADDKIDARFSIYGLTPENQKFLTDTESFSMLEGELMPDDNGIAIAKEKADLYDLKLGDKVKVEATDINGEVQNVEFEVTGIYANGAGWDNAYGFLTDKSARDLFAYPEGYYDLGKIYLNDKKAADAFADDLDAALVADSEVLRAESSSEASGLYPSLAMLLKAMFNLFIIFLLVVIAIGLRSTVRMNLFERMREFGTLRAIGYSRRQSFSIIFNESFFLSILSLAAAFVPAVVLVLIFGEKGVYLGPGPLSYFGGEWLYPSLRIMDVILALVVIVVFALISVLSPGLQLCYQNITDIMARRQKKVFIYGAMLRSLFGRGNTPKPSNSKSHGA